MKTEATISVLAMEQSNGTNLNYCNMTVRLSSKVQIFVNTEPFNIFQEASINNGSLKIEAIKCDQSFSVPKNMESLIQDLYFRGCAANFEVENFRIKGIFLGETKGDKKS